MNQSTSPDKAFQNVVLHLERLRRHYELAVRTYDHISLLDLSHSLRMWVELKTPLTTIAPKFASAISFKTATPLKKYLKQHVVTSMFFYICQEA